VHLPHCYLPCDSQRPVRKSEVSRREFKLPEDVFLFSSFVNSYKITPPLFDIWMRLLQAVPDSLLWLLSPNRWVATNLRREAEVRGVNSERLVFSERLPLDIHLARHRIADLFLDTFPYNGHTTASDALRCGLPMVTCRGQTFASRVAASLLSSLGLEELIADDASQYEAIALRFAEDPEFRKQVKAKLEIAVQKSPVFDSKAYTKHLEEAFRQMWRRSCRGEQASPIVVGGRTM